MFKKPNGDVIEGQFKGNRISGFAIETGKYTYHGNWKINIKTG